MKPIPLNNEIELVARRIVWFESPEEALADPVRFLAYAMARATHEDMKVIRRYVDDTDFLEALEKTPPGIIDPRSWPTGGIAVKYSRPSRAKATCGVEQALPCLRSSVP